VITIGILVEVLKMIKLYHNDMSSCAQKVRFALAEKELAWEGVELDLRRGDQQKPDYLKINPKGLVPALEHDGHIIVESNIILDYLNEAFPEPSLMPSSPLDRSRVRWWMKRLDDGLHLDIAALSFGIAFRHQLIQACGSEEAIERHINSMPDPYMREVQRQVVYEGVVSPRLAMAVVQFAKLVKDLDDELRKNPWIGGERLSLADIAYAPYVTRLEHLQMHGLWDGLSGFEDWIRRLKETPGYKKGLVKWFNPAYIELMEKKGTQAWPDIENILRT
jgi:glutathione S-transferase